MDHFGCGIWSQMRRMTGASLKGQPSRADEHVGLARREAHPLHAEARQIEPRARTGHELDGAAAGAERHRP
jgi:hypothetical protein